MIIKGFVSTEILEAVQNAKNIYGKAKICLRNKY